MKSFLRSLLAVVPLAALVAACSSNTPVSSAGGACVTNSDCSSGQVCGFNVGSGCNATGQCVTPSSYPFPACGCQGQAVSYVTNGFAASPVVSGVACQDAAPPPVTDSGAGDAEADAESDAASEAAAPSEAGTDSGVDASADGSTDATADAAAD